MSNEKTFHIGVTMAGAVSAGAYTAGFIDYMIEILELWEEQKRIIRGKQKLNIPLDDFEKKIPLHDICIDAFGGASAGGMVGMITALSTYSKMPPVKKPTNKKTGNILYDSWVLLDDDLEKEHSQKRLVKTFEKMLFTDDFEGNSGGIPSLLNSKSIDRIANKVFEELVSEDKKRKTPPYISKDLRVLLTLCSLRGIPFEFNFKNITSANFPHVPGHRMNEHMIIAHFKLNYNEDKDRDVYLKFNPYDRESKELLKLCTKATGAFPIGLAPRHFKNKLSKKYIENCIRRNLEIENKDAVEIKIDEAFFDFTDIDGGTINNEPYSEVVQVLEANHPNTSKKHPKFGTIMVDPFPNFYNQDEAKPLEDTFFGSHFQKSFWSVIPKAYTTFREQVRVKHSSSFYKDYLRFLVFPIKWEKAKEPKDHPPLSCAALEGFGGFLDIEFRKHDFFLGRNNARNFFRAFFMLEYDKKDLHPLLEGISKETFDTFRRIPQKNNPDNKVYFPIIPDINYIEDKENDLTSPYYYTINEFPKLDRTYFKKIRPSINNRVKKMLIYEVNNRFKGKRFLRTSLKLASGFLSKKITSKVISVMEKDFKRRGMLNKIDK